MLQSCTVAIASKLNKISIFMLWELRKVLRVMCVSPVYLVNLQSLCSSRKGALPRGSLRMPDTTLYQPGSRLKTCRDQVRTI